MTTTADRFRQAYADAPAVFGPLYPRELAHMKTRLRAWMAKTGATPIAAALAIEARETWAHRKTLALAAAVEILAEDA